MPKEEDPLTPLSQAKPHGISPLSILAAVFAALSFSMLLFSPFGPIDSSYIPFHPIGWAGIFVFLAMLCAYSQRYQRTKDIFWFLLALIFFPVLLSDLYFFPIQPVLGFGMAEWMGVQSLFFFVSFAIVSKLRILRYTNLAMLTLLPIGAATFFLPQLGLSVFLIPLAYLYGVTAAGTLSYYAYMRKEYIMIVGVVLNFLVSIPIPMLYLSVGYIPFGWDQPMMAVVTDRIAIFGRILMVVSWPALAAFWAKSRNLEKA